MAWTMTPRRRAQRSDFIYWPLATPFLLAAGLIVIVVGAFLLVGVLSYAFARLGISPVTASLVLLACLIGSAVNIPVARLSSRAVRLEPYISVFGLRYFVPVMRRRATTLAVNVGGAVVPVMLSAYLIAHEHLGLAALAAVVLVAALVHLIARPVPGLGIAVPALLPGLFAVLVALLFHPVAIAALAYVGGTLGTLIGADLANVGKVRKLGAPLASIGGAGTFDGIFIAGVTAVLPAALI
jgi:uncharacterized membrane protein